MKKFWKIFWIVIGVVVLILGFFYFKYPATDTPELGLTFSYKEAQGLGFDWKTMYLDILSDLQPKNLRLMTYWNDLEPKMGQYNFDIIDQELAEAQKRNIKVIVVVGRKQPRWPECFEPDWFKNLTKDKQDQAQIEVVRKTVEHLKGYTAIADWQVENEPQFSFGAMCPIIPLDLLRQEISTVKSQDARPVIVTDSGEIGKWLPTARTGADIFGATMYRVAYNSKYGGYYKYPLPAAFYRIKAGILTTFSPIKQVYGVELQMEPWFNSGAFNTPLDLQRTLMNPKVFDQNLKYAKQSGFAQHYMWGVEWWYWMAKKNGDWGMWNAAKIQLKS
jgi:hypothetical protein